MRRIRGFGSRHRYRYLILYLYAEIDRYPYSRAVAEEIWHEFPSGSATFLAINNFAAGDATTQFAADGFDISGDNTEWDFSGWQRGVDWAQSRGIHFDVVIFINDAFLRESSAGKDRWHFRSMFNPITLSKLGYGVVGHVSAVHEIHRLIDFECSHWIRTNAFAASSRLVMGSSLVTVTRHNSAHWLPSEWTGDVLLPLAPVNGAFRKMLNEWLGVKWERAGPINHSNWPFFRQKALAIINERLLSARWAATGARFFEKGRVQLTSGASPLIERTLPQLKATHL